MGGVNPKEEPEQPKRGAQEFPNPIYWACISRRAPITTVVVVKDADGRIVGGYVK